MLAQQDHFKAKIDHEPAKGLGGDLQMQDASDSGWKQ
jgi:hypothetical protein